MKEYNKQFEYRGYQFNILVELDYRIEYTKEVEFYVHRITCNCMGFDNYYNQNISVTDELVARIEKSISDAREYVDQKLDGPPLPDHEKKLIDLGFKPDQV